MDTQEIRNMNADSLEVSKGTKGDFSYKVKVYGDSTTDKGRAEMKDRAAKLKADAEDIAK